jgi:hypothetical protein
LSGEQMNTRVCLLTISLLLPALAIPSGAAAGDMTNIRSLGMAQASTAASRGLDAVGVNPANLALDDDATVTLSLMPVGVAVGSDFLTYGLYNKFFTGVESPTGRASRNLSEGDKQELLSAFPGGSGRIGGDAEIRPVGLALRFGRFGTFALTATDRIAATAVIPASYAKFLLDGVTPGSAYDFGGARGGALWTREYALSVGFALPDVPWFDGWSGGISLKLVHGYAYASITRDNTWLTAGGDGVLDANIDLSGVTSHADFTNSPLPAPAGSGIGVDIGLSAAVNDFLIAAVSVTDIGSLSWDGNVKEIFGQGRMHLDDPMNNAQRDSLEHAVTGDTRTGSPFTVGLPTTLRMGVQIEMKKVPWVRDFLPGEMTAACDYRQAFADEPGSSRVGHLSLGLEYRPWHFLPLRTGIAMGGEDRFNFALGFGLRFWVVQLDVASEDMGWLFSHDSFSRGSLGFALTLKM